MPVLIILLLIVGAVLVIAKGRKSVPTYSAPVVPEKTVPERVEVRKTVPPREEAVRVYLYEELPGGWCCPNCECENHPRRTNCCVCNFQRG